MTASWREAGRSVLARSGKLLFGLGMAATLPATAAAARKDKRAEEDDARKEERRDAKADESGRDNQNHGGANAESSDKSADRPRDEDQADKDRSEKRERRDERSESNDESVNEESTDGGRGSATRKQEADASDDDGGGRNERRTEDFAQRARDDEPDLGDTTDDILPPAVPSNPTIPVATSPDVSDVDLFIEANPDVIASTSTSGGFAFARSGDVIAISGPDGATIVQTDDPADVVTPSPSPDEPSDDGGNNDIDFTS